VDKGTELQTVPLRFAENFQFLTGHSCECCTRGESERTNLEAQPRESERFRLIERMKIIGMWQL